MPARLNGASRLPWRDPGAAYATSVLPIRRLAREKAMPYTLVIHADGATRSASGQLDAKEPRFFAVVLGMVLICG
jgi:hypothetical protein